MPKNMNLNIPPYYDDFDETKNYLQILFRPGYAIQARELTQIQSIFRNQIGKFADRIFENNTPVVGANIDLNFDKQYVILDANELNTVRSGQTVSERQRIIDKFNAGETIEFKGVTSGAMATVTHIDMATNKIFFDYRGGKFETITGETLELIDTTTGNPYPTNDTNYLSVKIVPGGSGTALLATVDSGIVYVNGDFVIVEPQETFIDRLRSTDDYTIGFSVVEEIVDEAGDITLFDPAQGSYNFNAPGATRYKKYLRLAGYKTADLEKTNDKSFFGQLVVSNKKIIKSSNRVSYSDIIDLLAKRTYDQSGNYVVDNFEIHVEQDSATPDQFDVKIDAGKAYVLGYEVETISPTVLKLDKARTAEHIRTSGQITHYVSLGPYIDIAKTATGADDIHGIFDSSKMPEVVLFPQANGLGTPLTDSNGNTITFRIAAIQRSPQDELRIFFADAQGKTDILTSAKSIGYADRSAWANLEKYANGLPVVGGKDAGIPIVQIEGTDVLIKSVYQNQTTFQSSRSYLNVPVTGGSATISADNNFMDFVPGGVVEIVDAATGTPITGTTTAVNSVQNGISTITISNIPAGTSAINAILMIDHHSGSANYKTKTRSQVTETLSAGRANNNLSHTDIIRLVSVRDITNAQAPIDVTDHAILDNGQRDFFYDYGSVEGLDLAKTYEVTYEYYQHSTTGKYFCADSYPIEDYGAGVSYTTESGLTTYDLRNCLDFRPSIDALNTGGVADIIASDKAPLTLEYDYYVGRIDKLYVTSDGTFSTIKGIPARIPVEPNSIDDVMMLATITIPAYTTDIEQIAVEEVDNRRYTMKEIGELENRIYNLESYTAMTLLESDAAKRNITDQTGNNLFKNGILVDPFKDENSGDRQNPEYRCSIDTRKQQLRGDFVVDHVDLHPTAESFTGLKRNSHTVTLDWSPKVFITQNKASRTMNVNPYAIHSWVGQVTLNPNTDHWIERVYYPTVYKQIGNPVSYQTWTTYGAWQVSWSGWSYTYGWRRRRSGHHWRNVWSVTGWRRVINYRRQVTTTTVIPTFKQTVSDKVISASRIPWMRSRWIRWYATGMRPGIPLKAYFGGVDVSRFCYGLYTNSQGNAWGWFWLPPYTFRAGKKMFKLVDAIDGEEASYATAFYTSSGILQRRQKTVTSIYGSYTVRSTYTQSYSRTVSWVDPLAQSFLVDTPDKKGVFLDSIDIYFASKDETLPITLHIVEMENGMPTQRIVPMSEVTLSPSEVKVNSSGNPVLPTKFKFSNPVYLQEQNEYAFVLISNSNNYNVFVGGLGENDLLTGRGIFKQPYAGVMFKSQNSSTWTADQNTDIMFTIHRCAFTPNVSATYSVNNYESIIRVQPISGVEPSVDFDSPIIGTSGARGVVIGISQRILTVDAATIAGGQFAVNDIVTGQTSGAKAYITHIEEDTTNSTIRLTIGDMAGAQGLKPNQTPISFASGEQIVAPSGAAGTLVLGDHWEFTVSTRNNAIFQNGETLTDANGTPQGTFIDEIPVSKTKWATACNLTFDALAFDGTTVEYTHKFASDTSFSKIVPNEDVEFTNRKTIDNANLLEVDAILTTTSEYVTPVISNHRIGMTIIDNDDWKVVNVASAAGFILNEEIRGTTLVGYVKEIDTVNNILKIGNHNRQPIADAETLVGSKSGASTTAIIPTTEQLLMGTYITKPVELNTPADDLRVIFDGILPSGTEIRGYFSSIMSPSQYTTIAQTGAGANGVPAWADPTSPLNGANNSILGANVYIYDISTAGSAPLIAQAVVTKLTNDRVYLKSISDLTPFNGTITTNNIAIMTAQVDAATITTVDFQTYNAATTYALGDFAIFGDMIWKANRAGVLAEPSLTGTDWTLIPSALSTNTIVTESETKWRPLKYEHAPSGDTSIVTEYTMIPDEIVGDSFSKFSVKLELYSKNPAIMPKVENFKAIAVS